MITKEDATAVVNHLNWVLRSRMTELEKHSFITDQVVKRTMLQVTQSEINELTVLIDKICAEHKILHYVDK